MLRAVLMHVSACKCVVVLYVCSSSILLAIIYLDQPNIELISCLSLLSLFPGDATSAFIHSLPLQTSAPPFKDLRRIFELGLVAKDGTPVRLPVDDPLFEVLVLQNNTLTTFLQPVSTVHAWSLSSCVSAAVRTNTHDVPDEITLACE
jgi:hypothetical protein